MKRFGTTHLDKAGCRCCTSPEGARAKVKRETFKLIKEEEDEVYYLGHSVSKKDRHLICSVCGDMGNDACVECCQFHTWQNLKKFSN